MSGEDNPTHSKAYSDHGSLYDMVRLWACIHPLTSTPVTCHGVRRPIAIASLVY